MGVSVIGGSDRASDLGLDDFAHVAVDMGVEIRTQRLMNVTHPERLVSGSMASYRTSVLEKKLPATQHAKPLREPWALPDHIPGAAPDQDPRPRIPWE